MRKKSQNECRGEGSQSTSDGESTGFCTSVLERDRIFESLGHAHRRHLCYLLRDRSELQVDEAVAAIAERKGDDGTAADPDHERIKLSLLHNHIPKLRSRDVVDFDPQSETLVTDDAEPVLAALEAVGTTLCADHATDGNGEAA